MSPCHYMKGRNAARGRAGYRLHDRRRHDALHPADDAFPMHRFDFMLSNPPHGRSWKAKLERMGGRERMRDRRFAIEHAGDPGFPGLPDDRQPDAVGPGTI